MFRKSETADPPSNHLLSTISAEDYQRLQSHLHPVKLSLGDIVGDSNGHFGFAYFPTTCVISLICTMQDGATAEVGLAGNDGMLGTSVFLGGNTTNRAIVGIAGEALRIDATFLKDEFVRGSTLQRVLLRYTEALIGQISLTAACNRVHTLEKRFCRWLLLIRDRATSDELVMTQEFIANILGGRRETVTVAAGRLQDAGLIEYSRGHLKIVDRKGLENTVCECYRAVRNECTHMFDSKGREVPHCVREVSCKTRASSALS
jgi:hypothetical protein